MDHFHEQIVIRKNKSGAAAASFFLTLLAIAAAVYCMLLLGNLASIFGESWLATGLCFIEAVVFGALAFVLFSFRNRFRVEYEYAFTNGLIEIAQVVNNSKRKELISIGYKDVEAWGLAKGGAYEKYSADKSVKRVRAVLTQDHPYYFIYTVRGEAKSITVIEPDEEFLALMHEYFEKAFAE